MKKKELDAEMKIKLTNATAEEFTRIHLYSHLVPKLFAGDLIRFSRHRSVRNHAIGANPLSVRSEAYRRLDLELRPTATPTSRCRVTCSMPTDPAL